MVKLPVFEMIIEDSPASEIGVSFVALVPNPAIEKNFMAFNSLRMDFSADEDKRIISGPAMVAESLIYRKDDNGEYNVFFSKNTIEQIALKFFKTGCQKNLNLFHDPTLCMDGITIFESFVTDKARGIMPMKGYEDLPEGTWFISCKVENEEIWNKVKAGEVKGFSVEGIFSYVKKPAALEEQISEILSRTFDSQGLLKKNDLMSSVKEMVAKFKKTFFETVAAPINASGETSAYTLKDGTVVSIDKLEVGGIILIAETPAPAGDHELIDGTILKVGENGVISVVTPPTKPDESSSTLTPEQQMEAVKAAVNKFAAGTPEERMANLETVAKALMDYSFGWEIRKTDEETQRQAAIAIYKTGFEQHKLETARQLAESKKVIERQEKVIAGLFSIVEQLAELPTGESVSTTITNFSSSKKEGREARVKALAETLNKLKTA